MHHVIEMARECTSRADRYNALMDEVSERIYAAEPALNGLESMSVILDLAKLAEKHVNPNVSIN